MKRILIVLFVLILAVSVAACSANDTQNTETQNAETQNTVPATQATPAETEEPEELMTVSTPFADLKVPASFEGKVSDKVTSEDPYTVSFFTEDGEELFAVVFNGEGDILLGTLIGENENTVIYMNFAELDKTDENYEAKALYQEQAGLIVNYLKQDYEFVTNGVIEREDSATFDIETKVGVIKYPERWKDKVTIDVADDAVRFSSGDVKLFDISFVKTENGYPVGKYKDKDVYLVIYELEKGEKSEEDFAALNLMQEDYSVALDSLMKDSD